MAVLYCGHCGAPRDPRAQKCGYCSTVFADPETGKAYGGIDPDIEAALRKNNLIEAIKLYRQRHKTSLVDAKDAIEKMRSLLR